MPKFKQEVIQLPTSRDTAPMPTSTKHVYHGPMTLLQTTYPDGGIHTMDFEYIEDATVESLRDLIHTEVR